MAVVVNGPIHVPPDAGDTDVGFVDEPPSTDRVTAISPRVLLRVEAG